MHDVMENCINRKVCEQLRLEAPSFVKGGSPFSG
jgi:hypothetical protein